MNINDFLKEMERLRNERSPTHPMKVEWFWKSNGSIFSRSLLSLALDGQGRDLWLAIFRRDARKGDRAVLVVPLQRDTDLSILPHGEVVNVLGIVEPGRPVFIEHGDLLIPPAGPATVFPFAMPRLKEHAPKSP